MRKSSLLKTIKNMFIHIRFLAHKNTKQTVAIVVLIIFTIAYVMLCIVPLLQSITEHKTAQVNLQQQLKTAHSNAKEILHKISQKKNQQQQLIDNLTSLSQTNISENAKLMTTLHGIAATSAVVLEHVQQVVNPINDEKEVFKQYKLQAQGSFFALHDFIQQIAQQSVPLLITQVQVSEDMHSDMSDKTLSVQMMVVSMQKTARDDQTTLDKNIKNADSTLINTEYHVIDAQNTKGGTAPQPLVTDKKVPNTLTVLMRDPFIWIQKHTKTHARDNQTNQSSILGVTFLGVFMVHGNQPFVVIQNQAGQISQLQHNQTFANGQAVIKSISENQVSVYVLANKKMYSINFNSMR